MFNEGFLFSAIAKESVRLLTLNQDFFVEHKDLIVGLEEAVTKAEDRVEEFGVPACDYQVYSRAKLSPI